MRRVACFLVLLCLLGTTGVVHTIEAQVSSTPPPTRTAGKTANLFHTLDPNRPIDGVRLQLPDRWTVQAAHLLRYGTRSVPVELRPASDGTVFLTPSTSIQGPHELVVRVQLSRELGQHEWHLTPFVQGSMPQGQEAASARQLRTADRQSQTIKVSSPPRPDNSNFALDLERATSPLLLRMPNQFALGRREAFTVEFWLRTHGLDEVVLSSWTGEEHRAYPLEFVVDQSGRLRVYTGRSGRHQALRTKTPVADGHWHHAAAIYDADDERLRLMLNGMVVDSLRARALPPARSPRPLALGGRRPRNATQQNAPRPYSGRLDELRIWPTERPAAALRQMKDRPFAEPSGEEGPFRLHFDTDMATDRLDWAEGARRVPSRLTFRSALRDLQAQTDGESVTLRWTAQAQDGRFLIERSRDGTSFTTIDRLFPSPNGPPSGNTQEMTYTDNNVLGPVVYYRIRQVAPAADTEHTTGTIKIGLGADPSSTRPVTLIGNFPNPFRESSTIAYRVEESQPITLTVWDVSGKRIATLAEGMHDPGYYEHTLRAGSLPSGPYFARLETAQGVQSHRMVLLK